MMPARLHSGFCNAVASNFLMSGWDSVVSCCDVLMVYVAGAAHG